MKKDLNYFEKLLFSHLHIFQNTFWLYLSEIFSRAFHLLLFFVAARILGKEVFGIFNYVLALVSFYFLFSDFGVSQILIRDYQQKEDKKRVLEETLSFKFLISLLVTLISFSGYLILKSKEYSSLLYFILVLYFFIFSLKGFFLSFFIALQKSFFNFLSNLIESITILSLALFFSLFHRSSLAIGLAYLFSSFLSTLFSLFFFERETKLKTKEIIKNFFSYFLSFKYYFINGLPLVFFGLLAYVFFSTDQIIIGHFREFSELGDYAVASKVILAASFVGYIFSTSIFPFLASLTNQKERFKKYFYFFLVLHLILGIFVSYLTFIFSPLIVYLGFGPEYLSSLPYIYTLLGILIFMVPTSFLDYVLFSFNKQLLDFFITLLPASLNLILNLFLVPTYGAYGAIFSSLLAQFLNFILTLIFSLLAIEKKI